MSAEAARSMKASARAAAAGAARAGRRADRPQARRHHLRSARRIALGAYPDKLTRAPRALGQGRARPRFPRAAHRRRRLADADLRAGARAGARHRAGAAGAESVGRAADRILSGNDIEHALLGARRDDGRHALCADLGALFADVERLRQAQVDHADPDAGPGVRRRRQDVRARDRGRGAARRRDRRSPPIRPTAGRRRCSPICWRPQPTAAVDAAHAKVGPDTIAKFLFTSGSTGYPKGVINTQRMLCANQAMIRSPACASSPTSRRCWSTGCRGTTPSAATTISAWCSTTAARSTSTRASRCPAPSTRPCATCSEIAPTIYFNVPKGFEMLLPLSAQPTPSLRKTFFSRLKVLFYAGAGLQQYVWDELQELSVATCGERIIFLSSLGSTETAPLALACTWDFHAARQHRPAAAGHRAQARAQRRQARSRGCSGPNITPGYWRRPDLTAEAFDDEGFYKIGDAVKFADADDPSQGLLFDGRLAEDFKLAQRHLGQRRRAARAVRRPLRAAGARRGDRRRRPRRHRGAGVSRHRSLPQACRALPPTRRLPAVLADAKLRDEFRDRLDCAGAAKHRQLDPHLPACC